MCIPVLIPKVKCRYFSASSREFEIALSTEIKWRLYIVFYD